MFRNLEQKSDNMAVIQSYLGLLSHGNGRKFVDDILAHNLSSEIAGAG